MRKILTALFLKVFDFFFNFWGGRVKKNSRCVCGVCGGGRGVTASSPWGGGILARCVRVFYDFAQVCVGVSYGIIRGAHV